jgi:tetratricopeptide (TPR) repeat protein
MKERPAILQAEHCSKMNYSAHSKKMKPVEYFLQVKAYLRKGKLREAFELLEAAVMHFPNEPTLLSYYGCLLAIVERKYRKGIETCQKAIEKLEVKANCDEDMAYPLFYYNLGKAYSAAGKRKESLDAFNKGLSYDPGNDDIQKELRSMGVRKRKPPIPFLDRSHPLNKYIGIALYRRKK